MISALEARGESLAALCAISTSIYHIPSYSDLCGIFEDVTMQRRIHLDFLHTITHLLMMSETVPSPGDLPCNTRDTLNIVVLRGKYPECRKFTVGPKPCTSREGEPLPISYIISERQSTTALSDLLVGGKHHKRTSGSTVERCNLREYPRVPSTAENSTTPTVVTSREETLRDPQYILALTPVVP